MTESNEEPNVEQKIINLLITKPVLSVPDIAKDLGYNYFTVRQHILRLREQGLVKVQGRDGNKHFYSLVMPDQMGPNNSIPMIKTLDGRDLKLTGLLNAVGTENNMMVKDAATGLPRVMAKVLMAALRYRQGTKYNALGLNLIRREIENNIAQMEYVISIYKLILKSDVFWDEFKIGAVTMDKEFSAEQVKLAHHHYFPKG